jgi:hypothetical protein
LPDWARLPRRILYEPFRTFLSEQGIAADTIVAAAVFTIANPDADMATIRDATRAAELPTLNNVTVCGENVTSPCANGARGACVNPNHSSVEQHATYRSADLAARSSTTPSRG